MKKPFTTSLFLTTITSAAQQAFAAFQRGKYRNIVVPSFNYYTAKDVYNSSGKKVKPANNSSFSSYAFGLYFGYGVTRRLDLIVNVLAPNQQSQFTTSAGTTYQQSFGFGDLQAGLSYALVNFGYKSYLSVQVTGIAPLYKHDDQQLDFGYGAFGSEVKLMYTGSINCNHLRGCYSNLEAGFRMYFAKPGPSVIVYSALFGVPLDKRNQVSFEVGGQNSSSYNKSFVSTNLSINRDFAFTKGAVNYGHTFNRRFSLFGGGFYTFMGRNAGVGYGGSLQAVLKI